MVTAASQSLHGPWTLKRSCFVKQRHWRRTDAEPGAEQRAGKSTAWRPDGPGHEVQSDRGPSPRRQHGPHHPRRPTRQPGGGSGKPCEPSFPRSASLSGKASFLVARTRLCLSVACVSHLSKLTASAAAARMLRLPCVLDCSNTSGHSLRWHSWTNF